MEKIPYYAITVRRYNILFRHTEWFHQTQDLYNEILLFYYQLYLEIFTDEQPGTQEALRILEKLTIVGRDKQPVPNPLPWKKVPLYFRRAAINTATAAAKSYLAREEQEQPTEAFTESVTFYKGMYRDFQQNTISLKLWDGEEWQWSRLRLRGNTVPEEGQMMSPALVLKKDHAELHIPWKIPVADGRGARERITAENKICSTIFTGQDAYTVCCILDSSGKRESSFYIKGGREYANASRQIYDRIKRSEDVQGGGGNVKVNYRYWKKLKNLHEHALADKPLPVYGEGLNVRDWLYVEDHCKAIDLIIHNGRVGEVYNVGGHNEKQNIEIVKIICKELGKPESLITHVGDRKGHDMRYAIDPTKIHSELGWLPETKFEDGIKKTIKWYLENREWWETIISGEYQNYYEKMYSNR
ncbi:dTDP-glucose 4,6-dehydratase [Blautia obeum]|uniref:dTDP-glucose 4,6-dehydratase 2 n=1 Tax=Blautia obeum TaxID=40520 RepID=A0A564UM86_9FIRM|nr:GDP-mannose 4,6-dehydratase [Blautia obeum]VUX20541.1 dTDP-glucose 4,6-dehydratase 2 [Blautia obeum]